MYERSRNLLECHIAGFTYYDGLDVIDELVPGAILTLKSEPDNPYDPNAVSIFYDDTKLGYIPRYENQFLSDLLYFGYDEFIVAKISSCNLEEHPEGQFRTVIKIRDNRDE